MQKTRARKLNSVLAFLMEEGRKELIATQLLSQVPHPLWWVPSCLSCWEPVVSHSLESGGTGWAEL